MIRRKYFKRDSSKNGKSSSSDNNDVRAQAFYRSLQGLPFWIWNTDIHKRRYATASTHTTELGGVYHHCCYQHSLGLPVKEFPRPLYDFQKQIIDAIEKYRLLWLLKSRGNGSSELLLRYLAYLATVKAEEPAHAPLLRNSQMCLVTGPRLELAVSLMTRLKKLFEPHGITFDSKETVVEFPQTNIRIEAFPSNNISSMRGLPNVSAIVADEFSFISIPAQAREALAVCEGYVAKNRSVIIVFMSTANRPEDVFMELGKQGSMYYPLRLDYRYGLDKIYSRQEIAAAQKSRSFAREFELQPLGQEGDLLVPSVLDKAILDDYDCDEVNPSMPHSIGVDIGWGSVSKSAWIVTRLNRDRRRIEVVYSAEKLRAPFQQATHHGYDLFTAYGGRDNARMYIDSSAPEYISAVKSLIGERPLNYAEHVKKLRDDGYTAQHVIAKRILVHSIPFSTEGRRMLGHVVALHDAGLVAIHPKFSDLINGLASAKADDDYGLLKDDGGSVHLDLVDSYHLSLHHWRLHQEKKEQQQQQKQVQQAAAAPFLQRF